LTAFVTGHGSVNLKSSSSSRTPALQRKVVPRDHFCTDGIGREIQSRDDALERRPGAGQLIRKHCEKLDQLAIAKRSLERRMSGADASIFAGSLRA
jgi:hypothetical protein